LGEEDPDLGEEDPDLGEEDPDLGEGLEIWGKGTEMAAERRVLFDCYAFGQVAWFVDVAA
jgi:hypothetical protein